MKNVLWLDAVNLPPMNDEINYYCARSVYEAIDILLKCEYPLRDYGHIEYIDVAYAAGEHVKEGGDYIEFLRFLECTGKNYPVRIHAEEEWQINELRHIVERNSWFEIDRDETVGYKQFIFHYDDSYPSATYGDILKKYDGQVCSARAYNYSRFTKVTVTFEDGYKAPVLAYELKAV